jgi:hypothetical protein
MRVASRRSIGIARRLGLVPAREQILARQSPAAGESVSPRHLARKSLDPQFSRDQQSVTPIDNVQGAAGLKVDPDGVGAEKHVVDIGHPAQRLGA